MAGQNSEKLVAEYSQRLNAFIRKRVKSVEDAEDILQEVFYQLVRTLDTAMNPIEHVSAWLYRVARNMIANHRAKRREEQMPTLHSDGEDEEIVHEFPEALSGYGNADAPSPEMEYMRSLVWAELEATLAELPAEQREIYVLTELEGLPAKEIAQAAGTPLNTLLSRKHYAMLHLRRRMRQLYEEMVYD
jgi:RNA polymerase sigma factor (sigma-70 family)